MVEVDEKVDADELRNLITKHVSHTNSVKGQAILDDFSNYLPKFKKIVPNDYKKMLHAIKVHEQKGMTQEEAVMEAFYDAKRGLA